MANAKKLVLVLFLLVISTSQQEAEGLGLGLLWGIGKWRSVLSVSQSLMSRVASLRASRGDLEGAERARKIAEKMEVEVLGPVGMRWEYARMKHARRDHVASWNGILRALSDVKELWEAVKELNSMKSDKEKARWIYNNYERVLDVSRSLREMLFLFARSEIMLIVQKEAEGELLRDCLEVLSNDFKAFLKVAKDIALNLMSSPSSQPSYEL